MWFKDKNAFVGKRFATAADTKELLELHRYFGRTLAERAESRDGSRAGHISRVEQLTGILVRAMIMADYPDFTSEYADNVILASTLHDVGKIAVSDAVLAKSGELSRAEAEELMRHAPEGGNILEEISEKLGGGTYISVAAVVARYHHERWNGCGYPDRLKGAEIPLPARIVSIADGFDCIVGEKKMDIDAAAVAMREFVGVYYDPALTDIFLSRLSAIKEVYNNKDNM
ncbi:MAG: HD domain-containing protein [Oscillospiraceae bacterium]|nr:HD domain-containing protein [Oscillospiraceae bacterium]